MSTGAITLQCPQCGGVFLTLQHAGQTEICPHCAVSGPRDSFRAVMELPRPRERTDLPSANKAENGVNNSPNFFVTARPPVLDTPFPLAPENFAVVPKGPVPLAKNPEPLPTPPVAPPAPVADVAPLPSFTGPAQTNGVDHSPIMSPVAPAAVPMQNRQEGVLPIPDFPPSLVGLENAPTQAPAAPTPAPPPASLVPMWPGLDLEESAPPTPEELMPVLDPPRVEKVPEVPQPTLVESPTPQKGVVRRRASAWPKLAAAAVIVLGGGWLVWTRVPSLHPSSITPQEPSQPVTVVTPTPKPVSNPVQASTSTQPPSANGTTATPPKPSPEVVTHKPPTIASANSGTAPSPSPAPAPAPANTQSNNQQPTPPTPAPAPVETTRPAVVASPALTDSQVDEAAAQAMKTLNTAKEMKDRLAVIADPDVNAASLEAYFASNKEPLEASTPEASSGFVMLMPSKQETRLFRVVTQRCPEGAMAFFHQKDRKALLDWPLFAQCQDHAYDQFAKATDIKGTAPKWFTILCRRTHSFDLKVENKDRWISLDGQGSLTPAGAAVVFVNKDTPAGRWLDANLGWDRIYLTDLLLGKLLIEGQSRNVVLDCAATRVDKPVAGAKK